MISKYSVKAKCLNCGTDFNLKIPKGRFVDEHLDSGKAKCSNCGCDYIDVDIDVSKSRKRPQANYTNGKKVIRRLKDNEW